MLSGFPLWLSGNDSACCNAGNLDSIPGSGRSPGGGHSPVLLPRESHGQRSLAGCSP